MSEPDRSLSFAEDIKPLFREEDRDAMLFAFDLWSYDDVSREACRSRRALRALGLVNGKPA